VEDGAIFQEPGGAVVRVVDDLEVREENHARGDHQARVSGRMQALLAPLVRVLGGAIDKTAAGKLLFPYDAVQVEFLLQAA
jgi:hypothetical protein